MELKFDRKIISKHQEFKWNSVSNHFRFFKHNCSKSKCVILFGTIFENQMVMYLSKKMDIKWQESKWQNNYNTCYTGYCSTKNKMTINQKHFYFRLQRTNCYSFSKIIMINLQKWAFTMQLQNISRQRET